MTSLSYRYLRRRLSGVAPTTGLARFALYVAVLGLLFVVLQRVLYLFAATSGAGLALGGWIQFLSAVLGVVGGWLLVRWMRRRLLWRLRNRLLVTYVFIGVIPVALVMAMALVAAYLFAGQFAAFLALSEMNHQMETMARANQVLADDLSTDETGAAGDEGLHGAKPIPRPVTRPTTYNRIEWIDPGTDAGRRRATPRVQPASPTRAPGSGRWRSASSTGARGATPSPS